MAVNQAQVDHIIQTASADDPEVKLLKLQDEVDLLKTSIKRLLIDIRERMNDAANPLSALRNIPSGSEGREKAALGEMEPLNAAPPAVSEQPQHAAPAPAAASAAPAMPAAAPRPHIEVPEHLLPSHEIDGVIDGISPGILALLRSGGKGGAKEPVPAKVRLKKVFRLFEWTTRNVKRFGHDRVDLMLESYRAMGYISDDSTKLVKDIARLLSQTLGEHHEIRAEEYVSELYELNRILNPEDPTLDREMVEVLLEQRTGKGAREAPGAGSPEDSTETGYISSRDRI
jgi:hypothetical protein